MGIQTSVVELCIVRVDDSQ